MTIDSACGCQIELTAEDMDNNIRTQGQSMIAKVLEHVMTVHQTAEAPITVAQARHMEQEIARIDKQV